MKTKTIINNSLTGIYSNEKKLLEIVNKIDLFSIEIDMLNSMFSKIITLRKKNLINKFTPYNITIKELIVHNEWTKNAHYIAINKGDGTLSLFLSKEKISKMSEFPYANLLWVLFHEFRHKIQQKNKHISSVTHHQNWSNANKFFQEHFNKDEDLINHIFHELNPAEVDANVFASEITGIMFTGNIFDINEKSLKLLL